jgi:hypothetical protein
MKVDFNQQEKLNADKEQSKEISNECPAVTFSPIERPPNDKVKKYIKQMAVWKRLAQKDFKERKQIHEIRLKTALKKKNNIFKQNIKKNVFYLHRWEYITEVSIQTVEIHART